MCALSAPRSETSHPADTLFSELCESRPQRCSRRGYSKVTKDQRANTPRLSFIFDEELQLQILVDAFPGEIANQRQVLDAHLTFSAQRVSVDS
jgi:hypothetical protein